MDDIQVVAPVGMPGAGKSTCVDYLVKKGLPSIYVGGLVVEEVKARGLEVNERNEKLVREDLRSKEGPGVLAKRVIPKVEELYRQGHKKILIDGLYSWTEYKIYKENFGDKLLVIAVTAPRRLRHQRLTKRPVRPLSENEANARDYAEIENIEKGGPIANADYTLTNDSDQAKLLADLDRVLTDNRKQSRSIKQL
ncbi:MAG TPA: AAA family ATPase [Candidatus Saccharimonadales bacterium]|nr:AAA family ATPase [Candidatus Saccharimonadales bacterium]